MKVQCQPPRTQSQAARPPSGNVMAASTVVEVEGSCSVLIDVAAVWDGVRVDSMSLESES